MAHTQSRAKSGVMIGGVGGSAKYNPENREIKIDIFLKETLGDH